jgi:hypothetical protein
VVTLPKIGTVVACGLTSGGAWQHVPRPVETGLPYIARYVPWKPNFGFRFSESDLRKAWKMLIVSAKEKGGVWTTKTKWL